MTGIFSLSRGDGFIFKPIIRFIILEPSDDGPLQARLDKWLAVMRAAYEQEAALWRDRIKRVKTATLQELGFDTEELRANKLRELQAQLDMVESENPIDGMPCKGRLKLTLEDVKRGHEGIRDAWMHEDWANKNGEDLGVMCARAACFSPVAGNSYRHASQHH